MASKEKPLEFPDAVVLGNYINALGIVRSLGENSIRTAVMAPKKGEAFYSRHAKGILCPDPVTKEKEFIDFLIRYGKKIGHKGILYATGDEYLTAIILHANKLSDYFHMEQYDYQAVSRCVNKREMYSLANIQGIPYPETNYCESIFEAGFLSKYPYIVKPENPSSLPDDSPGYARISIVKSQDELDELKNRLCLIKLDKTPYVVQEMIPGDTKNLYTVSCYSDKRFKIQGYSIGHKVRQYPPEAGTISAGRVVGDTGELFDYTQKIIFAAGFHGISNTEFKFDTRDGKYKLMEINARPGKWNYSATASGVNLSKLAYDDIMNNINQYIGTTDNKIFWCVWLTDFISFIISCRRKGYNKYSLNLFTWLGSMGLPYVDGLFKFSDIKPFFYGLKKVLFQFFKKQVEL